MVCYIVIVNSTIEINIKESGLIWVDFHDKHGKKIGIKATIYAYDDYNTEHHGSLDVIIYDDRPGFTIKGSLRKFIYGRQNAAADLSAIAFCQAICIIASRLKVPQSEIWYSIFTFMEFGANIILKKIYSSILNCISSYPRRKKIDYQDSSVGFRNESKENKFYDKLLEVHKRSGLSKKIYSKLSRCIFIFRYEVRLKPKNVESFCGNQIIDIYKNWNALIEYWLDDYGQVRFENKLPIQPEDQKSLKGLKEIKNYFITKGINSVGGLGEAKKIIYQSHSERKAEFFKTLEKSYQPNKGIEFANFIEALNDKIAEKGNLKKRL